MFSRTVSSLHRSCGLEVHRFDLHQREILLAFMWRTHLPADGVAGLQVELANLRRRDIDVVGTGKVVVVGGAKESVTIGEDFQHTFGEDVSFLLALRLEDLEDQVLLAQAAGAGQIELARDLG